MPIKPYTMKTVLISSLAGLLLLASPGLRGQIQKFTLLHNGSSSFYTTFSAAQTAAVNGDTIYLPGGNAGSATISKSLTIIGAGYHPDSTLAFLATIFDVALSSGASGGKLTGVIGTVQFPGSTVTMTSYTIKRCYINNLYGASSSVYTNNVNNLLITECIIISINNSYLAFGSVLFEKNILLPSVTYTKTATFFNNIFYEDGSFQGYYNSFLHNNIFIVTSASTSLSAVSSCTFLNNLFCSTGASMTISNWGSYNNFSNNLTDQLAVSTFVNATTTTFAYTNDYHLLPSSPGNNYGTDGTDLGIHGTAIPWKDGGLPFNPHIATKTIGSLLRPTGNLPINIKVTAQDR